MANKKVYVPRSWAARNWLFVVGILSATLVALIVTGALASLAQNALLWAIWATLGIIGGLMVLGLAVQFVGLVRVVWGVISSPLRFFIKLKEELDGGATLTVKGRKANRRPFGR